MLSFEGAAGARRAPADPPSRVPPPPQNWDGSGGNGAAMRHFQATGGKYPLVVKLGTITPSGKGGATSRAVDSSAAAPPCHLPLPSALRARASALYP